MHVKQRKFQLASDEPTHQLNGQLILYGTDACHLCELAEQMLEQWAANSPPLLFEKTDISLSDDLFARYGLRIPVLRRVNGAELDWPFDAAQLEQFLQS